MSDLETGAPILLFGPSRLARELQAFCVPELLSQWHQTAQKAGPDAAAPIQADTQPPPPPLPFVVFPVPGGLLAQPRSSTQSDEQLLAAAARQCTLLTAMLRPLAAAASLEAAAAAALQQLGPSTAQRHPLRTVCLDGSSARAPAERALRHRLQQLGLGAAPDPTAPPLWCIQHRAGWPLGSAAEQQQQAAAHFLLGLQLAAGAPLSTAASARQLGPTAMLPELAALSCSLAAVRASSVVLDPFCGTGSLLAAAADAGAALAVGSDIDATHFASGSGSVGSSQQQNGGMGSAPVLLQLDAACLQQLLPPASVDAIVTDLPYGYRTEVAVGGSAAAAATASAPATAAAAAPGGTASGDRAPAPVHEAESWQQLLAVLLRLASHVLVPGGRLLAWMPLQPGGSSSSGTTLSSSSEQPGGVAAEEPTMERQRQQLEAQGQRHGLQLLHLLPESRQGGYPRAAAVFERQDSNPKTESGRLASAADPASRWQHMLAALDAAAAAGLPAFNLPSQRQQQQQDPPAEESQAGSAAATADPAQCVPAAQGGPPPAAVEQRGLHYKHVRGGCKGTAIDVWRAAWLGDTAAIAEYAAAGGDVDARDRKGQSALQFAAGYGHEAAVVLLLQLGAGPSAAGDRSGMAALHRAAARNHASALSALLAAGADCWQRSAAGQTPLHYASQFGHELAVQLLLAHLAAAERGAGGREGDDGTERTVRAHLALRDAAGLSALHLAAQWGMAGAAQLLLEAEADANQSSACQHQLAPAHLAARWGHAPVLQALQQHGGNLRQRCGGRGWTPLDEAREWRRQGCIDMLQALEPN